MSRPSDPVRTIEMLWKYDRNSVIYKRIKTNLRREWPEMYGAIKRLIKQQEKNRHGKKIDPSTKEDTRSA